MENFHIICTKKCCIPPCTSNKKIVFPLKSSAYGFHVPPLILRGKENHIPPLPGKIISFFPITSSIPIRYWSVSYTVKLKLLPLNSYKYLQFERSLSDFFRFFFQNFWDLSTKIALVFFISHTKFYQFNWNLEFRSLKWLFFFKAKYQTLFWKIWPYTF